MGSHVSLPQGNKAHCNNEMNVTLARVSFSFCEMRAMTRNPVAWPGSRGCAHAKRLAAGTCCSNFRRWSKKCTAIYLRHWAFLQQQQQQQQKHLCKWDKMQKVLFTCKNTEGKSSNNVVVGFCCLFICRQAENLKLNSDGTPATHTDTKRGN